jgi:hypothetical protein
MCFVCSLLACRWSCWICFQRNTISIEDLFQLVGDCERIGNTSICPQERIYIFKYPKCFWRSLSEISLSFATLSI